MNWTPYLIAGGLGFLLSFLGGLIGGVGFGEILLRGLLSAIVFASGTFGLTQLLQKMFPELFETPQDSGGNLDLKVGDDSEYEMPPPSDTSDGFAQEIQPEDEASREQELLSRDDDELGDMDEFDAGGEFQDRSSSTGSASDVSFMGGNDGKDGVLLEGIDEDPATLAKAVQTVLKKDAD